MARKADVSAGILVYRETNATLEVLLAHPGGPFWARKDAGAWTIPKGLVELGADLLATAEREFTEETGFVAEGPFVPLAAARQTSGKIVHAFACRGDFDSTKLISHMFEIEWPPRSGQRRQFPEVDRAAGSLGQSFACGNFSATYSRIASDSQTWTSPSINVGTLPVPDTCSSRCLKSGALSEITSSSNARPATFMAIHGRHDHDE